MLTRQWDKSVMIKLGVLLAIAIVVCVWLVMTINKAKAAQFEKLSVAKAELSTLQNDAGQLSSLQAEYRTMQKTLAHLEPGVSPDRKSTYLPTLLKQIQKLADDNHVKLEQLNPGTTKVASNVPPPATPTGSTPSNGAPAAPAAPPAPTQVEVPISIRLVGTFPRLMAFIDGLKSFPKVINIVSMQLQPRLSADNPANVSPELGITMEATATVLPLVPGVGP
jgi:Tfp pilus assembly protein PilO